MVLWKKLFVRFSDFRNERLLIKGEIILVSFSFFRFILVIFLCFESYLILVYIYRGRELFYEFNMILFVFEICDLNFSNVCLLVFFVNLIV